MNETYSTAKPRWACTQDLLSESELIDHLLNKSFCLVKPLRLTSVPFLVTGIVKRTLDIRFYRCVTIFGDSFTFSYRGVLDACLVGVNSENTHHKKLSIYMYPDEALKHLTELYNTKLKETQVLLTVLS
tara:strand:- start:6380 stop:6766 length:387 start_codon:yes stop_codon:yes gene_type:complete